MDDLDRTPDRLYELLPAIYRMRDHAEGEPLRALLQIVAEQVELVETDIEQLYDNWFVETCEDWVAPYIGDLLGRLPVHAAGEPGDPARAAGRALARILAPRREIANTIRSRRRKGRRDLLEDLARDVAGWPARAVEFYRLLVQTPSVKYPNPSRGLAADLHDAHALDHMGGPFEAVARSVDVRRIASPRRTGRYAPPFVGVFAWRLRPYSITRAPAYQLEEQGANAYMFSALGADTPLYVRPRAPERRDAPPNELDLPAPIRRRALAASADPTAGASEAYYGLAGPDGATAQSLAIWAKGWPTRAADTGAPIAAARILTADLSDWSNTPPRDHVAVDPVLGRFLFPTRQLPRRGVWVSYHYGFSADMGGGEYRRSLPESAAAEPRLIRVAGEAALRAALAPWRARAGEDGDDGEGDAPDQPAHAIVEIADSGVYVVPINIALRPGHSLTIRAVERRRPVIRLLDWRADRPDSLTIEGGEGANFTLDGVVVAGRGMEIAGPMQSVRIRHATLVPGWSLEPKCDPRRPSEPSVQITDGPVCLVVEHSIVGSIQVNVDEVAADPVQIRISDSIVDATGAFCDGPACEAIGAPGCARAHATLTIARSTVIGRVDVHAIALAENAIFLGPVRVARRQLGCVRFCALPPGSRTPRRFNCQPDLAEEAARQGLRDLAAAAGDPAPSAAALGEAAAAAARRVRPRFASTRYGRPTYCQLAADCAEEIFRGADDAAEMGAFHDLFQPQRLANLRARLDESTPAGLEAGVILAT